MIHNYLKTTFRNLWKNKGFTFLNIFGLGIGIACASLIFLWVEDEINFNNYFSNKENLYKIKDSQTYDGTTFTFDATPGPLAAGIKTEIPGIKNSARSSWGQQSLFSLGEKNIYERGMYVDSSFLKMFQLEFVQGNAGTAFQQLHSLVITEKMAHKFFGNDNAIGKSLRIDNNTSSVVTGVIKDLPESVSFQFEWLAPFKIFENQNSWLQSWRNNGVLTYVELQPGADTKAINRKLYNYVQSKAQDAEAKMSVYPMSRWRLYDSWKDGKEVPGRIKYVNLFSLIAWIILLIACINFMNLSTARSGKRAREVGVRKVLGAAKSKLVGQFIGESVIMALISAVVAVCIIFAVLPAFNSLVEKQLSIHLFQPLHISALLVIAVVCGLVAGSYPAFYLSSFNPVAVLKGIRIKMNGSAGLIRKGLVVLQFSISIILIISTIIIYKQINHAKNRSLGYDKENLIYLPLQGKLKEHFNAVKNDLVQTGVVKDAALSQSTVLQLGSNTGDFQWQGKDPDKQVLITVESVSPEYTSTMGMRIEKGRNFYDDYKSDSGNIIINQTLAKIIGDKNIIGSLITDGDNKFTVVGVIDDFVYNNLYSPSSPLILFPDTSGTNFLTVRLKKTSNVAGALEKVENVIKANNPGFPFDYKFVDDQFGQFFKTEMLIGKLASVFAFLAIFISCLGLFGLAAYTAERRTKEIGIRKVLGASAKGLAGLLSKEFLILVMISCLIAFPIAWWMMHNWLEGYEYRVPISWPIFLVAGLLAMLIALFTVSVQAIKAALANPIQSLRSE
ncbi:MAG: ABC transporter permease [Ginsengibacter sp.]